MTPEPMTPEPMTPETDDAGTDDAGTDDAGTDDAGTDDAGTDSAPRVESAGMTLAQALDHLFDTCNVLKTRHNLVDNGLPEDAKAQILTHFVSTFKHLGFTQAQVKRAWAKK